MTTRRRRAGKGGNSGVTPSVRSRLWHCMMFATIVGALAAAILVTPITGAAQWVSLGPEGGAIGTRVIDPNTLIICTR